MLSYIYLSELPETVSILQPAVMVGSWFGMGLVEPLRAGLAIASIWPLAVLVSARSPAALLAVTLAVVMVGGWSADAWETLFSIEDDRRIVIDEVAGYLVGMALLGRAGWLGAGGFAVLFLTLDRLKPFPFHLVERVPGGIGVMLDDIVVGVALGLAAMIALAVWRRVFGDGSLS